MRELFIDRVSLVWLVLVAATVLSFEVGHGIGFGDVRHASAAVLIISCIKVRLVVLDFMELRHAPHFVRIIAEAWVVSLCAILVTLYFLAPASNAAA
ncbi:MAG: cytochrome C oxidase subunit IV family protein [Pseudomonadota bacterium]|jgi:hypothetical protein|nr:cytochrome C oxidase subunit IV family protein [Pseudomonadota bacterium]